MSAKRSANPAPATPSRTPIYATGQPRFAPHPPMTAYWAMRPVQAVNNHLCHAISFLPPPCHQVQHVSCRKGLPFSSTPVPPFYSNKPNSFQNRPFSVYPATQFVAPFHPSATPNYGNHRASGVWAVEQTIAANAQYMRWSGERAQFLLSQPRQYASPPLPIVDNLHSQPQHQLVTNLNTQMAAPIQQNAAVAIKPAPAIDPVQHVPESGPRSEKASTHDGDDDDNASNEEGLPEWLRDHATTEELGRTENVPYAPLIFMALKDAPNFQARLGDIYTWFKRNTVKHVRPSKTNLGWMNSIRHNLSTNDAFVKIPSSEKAKKGCIWRLSDAAISTGGISPTTRYRGGARVGRPGSASRPSMPASWFRGARGNLQHHFQALAASRHQRKMQQRMKQQKENSASQSQQSPVTPPNNTVQPASQLMPSPTGLTGSDEDYPMSDTLTDSAWESDSFNGLLPPFDFSPSPLATASAPTPVPAQNDVLRYPSPPPVQNYSGTILDDNMAQILTHDRRNLTDPVLIRAHDHLTGVRPYSPGLNIRTRALQANMAPLNIVPQQETAIARRVVTIDPSLVFTDPDYDNSSPMGFPPSSASEASTPAAPSPTELAAQPHPAASIRSNAPSPFDPNIDTGLLEVSALFSSMRDSFLFSPLTDPSSFDFSTEQAVPQSTFNEMRSELSSLYETVNRIMGSTPAHAQPVAQNVASEATQRDEVTVAQREPTAPTPLSATIQSFEDLSFNFGDFDQEPPNSETEVEWMLRVSELQSREGSLFE